MKIPIKLLRPTDARLLEIIRGYRETLSDPTTGPNMHSEFHLLALCQLASDETIALNQPQTYCEVLP